MNLNSAVRPRAWITATIVMFAISLATPVFLFENHEPVIGLTVLGWGWWGVPFGEVGWLANFPFVYALWAFFRSRDSASKVSSTAALLIGLTSFHATEWWFSEGSGTQIVGHGAGFYSWLLSFLLLTIGSWLRPHFAKAPTGGPSKSSS